MTPVSGRFRDASKVEGTSTRPRPAKDTFSPLAQSPFPAQNLSTLPQDSRHGTKAPFSIPAQRRKRQEVCRQAALLQLALNSERGTTSGHIAPAGLIHSPYTPLSGGLHAYSQLPAGQKHRLHRLRQHGRSHSRAGLSRLSGVHLFGYNRTPSRLDALKDKGVIAVDTIPALAAQPDPPAHRREAVPRGTGPRRGPFPLCVRKRSFCQLPQEFPSRT